MVVAVSGNDRRLDAAAKRIAKLQVPKDTANEFGEYRDRPDAFRANVAGFDSATRRSDGTPYQDEIMSAVVESPRVAVVAGHGVGKTRTLAALVLWWLLTRPLSRAVVLAPQFERQVRSVLFAEIKKLVRRAKVRLPVEVQAGRVVVHGYGPEWGIIGLPATEPDRIEGLHAEGGLLLIMDETKGVSQDVFDALQGALTGGDDSRLLIASTPGGPAGPFYRACSDDSGHWKVIRLSSEDSSIVSPQWCEDRAHEWGKDSALYQTRVQGMFADAGDGQLFSLSLLEAATSRKDVTTATPVRLGVDVARSIAGDQNCVCVTRGGYVERFSLWRSADLMATAQRVVHEATGCKPDNIRVDAGGVGGGVVDRLRQLRFNVDAVHFGGAASDSARFKNKRAEMYWTLRELLEKGDASLPDDDELITDLAAIRYSFDQSGRVVIEAKDDARKRLGRSPDRADALVLALGDGIERAIVPTVTPYGVPLASASLVAYADIVGTNEY